MQRHPNVSRCADVNTGEFRRRDSDDNERELVDLDGLTDNRRVAGKAVSPKAITQNRNICPRAIIPRHEQSSSLCRDLKNREEIVGIGITLSQSGASLPTDVHAIDLNSAEHSGKRCRL